MTRTTTILRCEVGSTAHGTGLEGREDLDEMSIAIPPKEYVLGLKKWEQDIIREDNGRNLGPHERSTPDTYELTRYSFHKWMALAVQGNPSIQMMLWAPVRESTEHGEQLRNMHEAIISRNAIDRYAGYMRSQALRLLGLTGRGHGTRGGGQRQEYIEEFGYDTKFAMHMLRLGFQGLELVTTGKVELPMHGEAGDFCRAVRKGEVPVDDTIHRAAALYEELTDPKLKVVVRDNPDYKAVNEFMSKVYLETWLT